MPNKETLRKYAEITVKMGLNLRKGQKVRIMSDVGTAEFARMCAEEAYKAGSTGVVFEWMDDKSVKLAYIYGDDHFIFDTPQYIVDRFQFMDDEDYAYLWIDSTDPNAFEGAPADRVAKAIASRRRACRTHSENTAANRVTWSIVAIPTDNWAKTVFPECKDADEAIEKLYDAIFRSVRLDTPDPVAAWNAHMNRLEKNADWLNEMNFKEVHVVTEIGTDITIGLAQDNKFCAALEHRANADHRWFIPNMPTEEVFGTPDCRNINGHVKSSMILNHNGSLVKGMELWFENGKVVKYDAEEGKDVLKGILDSDEGAKSLGEIAFVPYDSPISNLGIFFYNTLFDENAACHLALGDSYPGCVVGGTEMTREELDARGANNSVIHVDFMFGTKDATITGVTQDGKEVPIFVHGNWADR